jgi:hypothetical protein
MFQELWTWYLMIFNLEKIKQQLNESESQIDIDGNEFKSVYLGTVFELTPSGKFYMPWCSNVTEEETLEDDEWYDEARYELLQIGAELENGEGDPCDLFAVIWIYRYDSN